MKRTTIMGVILILLLSSLSFNTIGEDNKSIITVDDDGDADYTSIQDAIDNASEGDTVYVLSGFYPEKLIINKPINLQGENSETTIIDGNGGLYVIRCIYFEINISGFTIQNGQEGIVLWNCVYNNINDNIINTTQTGISLIESVALTISNNTIQNNQFGINLLESDNNHISNNIIHNNTEYGILNFNSSGNNYSHNKIYYNRFGMSMSNHENEMIYYNDISENEWGLDLQFNNEKMSTIKKNLISRNSHVGILCYNTSCNIISNTLIDNACGMFPTFCNGLSVNQNNFIVNRIQAQFADPSEINWDGNYWDNRISQSRKMILGFHFIPFPFSIPVYYFVFDYDMNPAKEPYDIPMNGLL